MTADTYQAPPGWYPDPAADRGLRWFDGSEWTNHTSTGQVRPATVPPPFTGGVRSTGSPSSFAISAMVLGGIALLFLPIILGPIGIVMGAVAKSKNEPLASIGLAAAIAGTIAGIALGALVALL